MAEVSLLGRFMPLTGGCYVAQYDEFATNDIWKHPVVAFTDTSTDLYIAGVSRIPSNYGSSPSVKVPWTAQVTTGNVVWGFAYRCVAAGESLDQATSAQDVTVQDGAPAAVNNLEEASITLNGTNFLAGRTLEWVAYRKGSDTVNDTLAGTVQLFDLVLSYTAA